MDFNFHHRILFLIALSVPVTTFQLQAQNDIAYGHLMSASIYYNPSFAGADGNTSFSHSFYDNNFNSDEQGFTSLLFSFDKYLPFINSGIGLIGYYNQTAPKNGSSAYIGGIYAKKIGVNDAIHISPSVKIGYIYNRNKMIMSPDSSGTDTVLGDKNGYDYSTGVLVNNDRFYAGISVDHLFQPKVNCFDTDDVLFRKYIAQFGYHYSWNRERSSLWHLNFIMQYQNRNSYLFVNDYLVSRKFRYRMGQTEYYYRILLGLGYRFIIEPENLHVAYLGFGLQDRNITLGGGVEFSAKSYIPRTFEVSLKYVIRNN